jgi:hypothetical protein
MEKDQQFAAFVEAYPAARRQRGYMAETLFLAALEKVSFNDLLAALEAQKRSAEWQKGMIPALVKWLQEEHWIRVLPEPAPARLSVADEARRLRSLSPQEQLRRLGVKR